ncbi:tRNA-dihydrouridine synthase family protein [Candidatus Micrarchaeota archaeon]|nr:tRNA-dihydrouridine synthase family protein [Candidatus Micrarchaeota archaeon]
MPAIFGLSPIYDYTDPVFRFLCGKCGADKVITEMVSADAVIFSGKTEQTLRILEGSPATAAQIFGSDPKTLMDAASILEKQKFTEINLNAGCPSKTVLGHDAGASLLKTPEKLKQIIETLFPSLKKPLSVKMRLGFSSPENSVKTAKLIEKAGASSVIVHARTVKQGYSGKADWEWIKKIKNNVGIPVYGNGDIWCWQDAYKMLEETGCDGVYIGRAAIGNPLIFQECKEKNNLKRSKISAGNLFREYYQTAKQNNFSLNFSRIALALCSGFRGSREVRRKITEVKNENEILEIFEN